jgi:hypothetical protein
MTVDLETDLLKGGATITSTDIKRLLGDKADHISTAF